MKTKATREELIDIIREISKNDFYCGAIEIDTHLCTIGCNLDGEQIKKVIDDILIREDNNG